MATAAILDLEVRMIPKLYNNYSRGFVMPQLVENDTSCNILAQLKPEISHFTFSKMAVVAILDLEVRMIPKPYNNHSSGFVMPELVENDT
jgi:zona occludens toxin (predicted ATPase)